jgi:putative nucleotidyltransferase with HDIG domain
MGLEKPRKNGMSQSSAKKSGRDIPEGMRKKEEGKLLVLELLELPTLSSVLNRVLKVAGDGRSGASDMAEVISKDQSLTTNILKIANSAYFGLSQQVPTVARAIVVLGFDAVKSIALSASVIAAFPQKSRGESFDRSKFWMHSLACAYLCKQIAGKTHLIDQETTFVCGLLHDIGKVALDIYFPDSYRRVFVHLHENQTRLVEAEFEILGFNHAEVGMWMAQRWRFPKSIVFSIANHHATIADDPRYKELTAVVRLANHICLEAGICLPGQSPNEPLDGTVLSDLKLRPKELDDVRDNLTARKNQFVSLFSGWDGN